MNRAQCHYGQYTLITPCGKDNKDSELFRIPDDRLSLPNTFSIEVAGVTFALHGKVSDQVLSSDAGGLVIQADTICSQLRSDQLIVRSRLEGAWIIVT